MVGHVEHKVLTHHGEADQANVTSSFWHSHSLQKLYRIAADNGRAFRP
jgi:hypothetical protein